MTQTGCAIEALQQAGVGQLVHGDGSTEVRGVKHDSRQVELGDLFVAIAGETHDGEAFVGEAVAKGASAVLGRRALKTKVPFLQSEHPRKSLAVAAELVYGSPTSTLKLVGITGTNGKTTSAYLLTELLAAANAKTALVGTTGLFVGERAFQTNHTTPEADGVSRFARAALREGASHMVMEVSSHGLSLHRVDGLQFDVAAFTNLTQDHLDYHGTLEAYGEAKARLFTHLAPDVSVINIDDPFGAELALRVQARRGGLIRCTTNPDASPDAEVRVRQWRASRQGIDAVVDTPQGEVRISSPMWGAHNLENMIVALGCAVALGLEVASIVPAWNDSKGSPGRLQQVADPRGVAVFVDYAHTPDALARVLDALRPYTPGRLFVVFGAGGDRDRSKRSKMGFEAASRADVCIVTNDNPRSESPSAIADEVVRGAVEAGRPQVRETDLARRDGVAVILDRRSAIEAAIGAASSEDTVLLAGKGHETVQVIGDQKVPFNDVDEARRAIDACTGRA